MTKTVTDFETETITSTEVVPTVIVSTFLETIDKTKVIPVTKTITSDHVLVHTVTQAIPIAVTNAPLVNCVVSCKNNYWLGWQQHASIEASDIGISHDGFSGVSGSDLSLGQGGFGGF